MGTLLQPNMPSLAMDEEKLTFLLKNAMVAMNDFIREKPFQDETISVYRPTLNGASHQPMKRPNLRDAVLSYQAERIELPAAKELMDYIWGHGGHPLTLTRDDRNPDQADWASNAFHHIVANPLFQLWNEYSIRSLCSVGEWPPWRIPEIELERAAKEIAYIEVGKGAPLRVTVPLLGLDLVDTEKLELETGITLRAWTHENLSVYLDKNLRYYPTDDIPGLCESKCYLEIVANALDVFRNDRKHEQVQDLENYIGTIMARVKWAIMQVTTPTKLITELLATAEVRHNMWGFFPIRRQGIRRDHDDSINMDVSKCRSAEKLLALLKRALELFPDLQDVLWLFDRATLEVLPRNILLESAIGLERLLVPDSGESTRRFKTYGAALLASVDTVEASKKLKNIYTQRSKAAHGGDKNPKMYDELAVIARAYLSETIASVVRLVVSLKIKPEKAGDRVNVAIERYLMSLMFDSARKDVEHAEKY